MNVILFVVLVAFVAWKLGKAAGQLDRFEERLGERVNAQPYWGRLGTRPRSPSIYRGVGK